MVISVPQVTWKTPAVHICDLAIGKTAGKNFPNFIFLLWYLSFPASGWKGTQNKVFIFECSRMVALMGHQSSRNHNLDTNFVFLLLWRFRFNNKTQIKNHSNINWWFCNLWTLIHGHAENRYCFIGPNRPNCQEISEKRTLFFCLLTANNLPSA